MLSERPQKYSKWTEYQCKNLLLAFNAEHERTPPGCKIRWKKIAKRMHRQGIEKSVDSLVFKFNYMKKSFRKLNSMGGINWASEDPYTILYNETFTTLINNARP
jgi:hypothetical protein